MLRETIRVKLFHQAFDINLTLLGGLRFNGSGFRDRALSRSGNWGEPRRGALLGKTPAYSR
jgi:hypothetical protein